MIHRFAAYTYSSTGTTPHYSASFILTMVAVAVVVAVLLIISMWKVFVKAGKPGWAAIIPLYNTWVMAEIIGKPGWWGLYPLLGFIPFVGSIASFVISIIFAVGLAKAFGKGVAFAIFGLILFSFVGYPILGFGSAQYLGPDGEGGAPGGPLPPAPGPVPPAPAQSDQPPVPPVSTAPEAPQPPTAPQPPVVTPPAPAPEQPPAQTPPTNPVQ